MPCNRQLQQFSSEGYQYAVHYCTCSRTVYFFKVSLPLCKKMVLKFFSVRCKTSTIFSTEDSKFRSNVQWYPGRIGNGCPLGLFFVPNGCKSEDNWALFLNYAAVRDENKLQKSDKSLVLKGPILKLLCIYEASITGGSGRF